MPTYEYACDKCGKQFEKVQKMSDQPGAVCPECGSPTSHRLISQSSFVLKGSGWYASDYSKKSTGTTPCGAPLSDKPCESACTDKGSSDTATPGCGCSSGSCNH